MFEQITEKRYRDAVSIVDGLRNLSTENIILSKLPDFTKSFIVNDGAKYNSKEELLKVIEKAVRLNLNYCLRPKWTLLNYLFSNFDSKSAQDICKKSDIFTYYTFYTESIKELCNDEAYLSLSRSAVEELINHINSDIHEKLTTNPSSLKIKNFFLQVFKLKYGDGVEISLDMTISLSLIKLFLEDKGFNDILELFNEAGYIKDDDEPDLKTIIKIITGKIKEVNLPRTEVIAEQDKEAEDSADMQKETEIKSIITDNKLNTPERERTIINPEATTEKTSSRVGYENTFEDTSTKEEHIDTEKISNEFIEREELGEKHLRFHFKDEEIKAISKKVFKGNKYELLDALIEIEKLKNWREATEYLKTIFINNKVNIGDKSAIMFVDVLNDYFEKR